MKKKNPRFEIEIIEDWKGKLHGGLHSRGKADSPLYVFREEDGRIPILVYFGVDDKGRNIHISQSYEKIDGTFIFAYDNQLVIGKKVWKAFVELVEKCYSIEML